MEAVTTALGGRGLDPSRLWLEITESAVIGDPEAAVAKLHRLKSLGVKLAVDDFGIGYSSLANLRELLPVDALKIDRSFVAGVGGNADDRAIVESVIGLAQLARPRRGRRGRRDGGPGRDAHRPRLQSRPGLPFRSPARPGRDVRSSWAPATLDELAG